MVKTFGKGLVLGLVPLALALFMVVVNVTYAGVDPAATVSHHVSLHTLRAPSCADAVANPTDGTCAAYERILVHSHGFLRDGHGGYVKMVRGPLASHVAA